MGSLLAWLAVVEEGEPMIGQMEIWSGMGLCSELNGEYLG